MLAVIHDPALDDAAAWVANPKHRWVYDKLIVAGLAGVCAGPLGVTPAGWPCIWRPIVNLDGMGRGAVVSDCSGNDPDQPGLFWSEMLYGEHVSTDLVVKHGLHIWSAQATGTPDGPRRFKRWHLGPQKLGALAASVSFCQRHLSGYSGPVNVETIGERVIEVHLRLTADWIECGAYDGYPGPCRELIATPIFVGDERTDMTILPSQPLPSGPSQGEGS